MSLGRVLVVGGTSGIGLATAQRLARAGAEVTVASRTGGRPLPGLEAAVLDTADVSGLDAFLRARAPFDHLVVTAARTPMGSVADLPLASAYAAMDSKFWGAYRTVRAAIQARALVPGGSITLVSGYLAGRPALGAILQGAINAGLDALARGLAIELAPTRVNTVSPGFVDTALWDGLDPDERSRLLADTARALPAGIHGEPDHIAVQIEAFMSNPYQTGTAVVVDGGATIS